MWQNIRAVWLCALALMVLAVLTMPLAVSRYVATGTGSAKARIAAFDVECPAHPSTGQKTLMFVSKHTAGTKKDAWYFGVKVKNTSEVTVRVQLKFYNVRQDDATIPASFDWTNPNHRRLFTSTVGYGASGVWQSVGYTPLFRIQAYEENWTTGVPLTDHRVYSTTAGQEGSLLHPDEEVMLRWYVSDEKYAGTDAVHNANYPNTNVYDIFDRIGDGSVDAAFRINYDIIATQVD